MSAPELDFEWMTERTIGVILASVDGDADAAARGICDVGERYGTAGVYSLCCALADAVARMAGYERAKTGEFWGVLAAGPDGPINPEDVGPGAGPVVAATRFVTAYLNDDAEQAVALFQAGEAVEDGASLPAGLMKLVQLHGQAKLREVRGG